MIKMVFKILASTAKRHWMWLFVLCASLILSLSSMNTLMKNEQMAGHWMQEVEKVDLWVYPKRPFSLGDLAKIRALDEVESAAPFCQKSVVVTLPGGAKQESILLGVEDLALPRILTQGKISHLQLDQSIIADERGIKTKLSYRHKGSKKRFKMGQYLIVGEHKMLLGGVCRLKNSSQQYPLLYTSYNNAVKLFEPKNDDVIAYVVKAKPGVSLLKLSEKIEQLFRVETKVHQLALADHVQLGASLKTHFAIWISLIFGIVLYLFSLKNLFSDLLEKSLPMRRLGMPLSFTLAVFGMGTFIMFLGSWMTTSLMNTALKLSCQSFFSIDLDTSILLFVSTFLVMLGFMMRGSYASYRV